MNCILLDHLRWFNYYYFIFPLAKLVLFENCYEVIIEICFLAKVTVTIAQALKENHNRCSLGEESCVIRSALKGVILLPK